MLLRQAILAIARKLDAIEQQGSKIMAAIDDLNSAVSALTSAFATLDTAVQAEIAALQAALAANNSAAVEAAVTNISAITSKMATDAAAMSASVAPPAAAAPAVLPFAATTGVIAIFIAMIVLRLRSSPPNSINRHDRSKSIYCSAVSGQVGLTVMLLRLACLAWPINYGL